MAFVYPRVFVRCDICGYQLASHTDEDAAREDARTRGWTVVDYAAVCNDTDATHSAFTGALKALDDHSGQPR